MDEGDEGAKRQLVGRARAFVGAFGSWRFALAVIGIAGLVAGALIAWRASSATPLLAISAVFVALALVDWEQISLSGRDWSASMSRTKKAVDEAVARVTAREDVPASAKEELVEVALGLDAEVAFGGSKRRSTPREVSSLARPQRGRSHSIQSTVGGHDVKADRVDLFLETDADFKSVQCTVEQSSTGHRWIAGRIGPNSLVGSTWVGGYKVGFVATFPADFPSAPTPVPSGSYVVTWAAELEPRGTAPILADLFRIAN